MTESKALAEDIAESAKKYLDNCGDTAGIQASRTAAEAADRFRADVQNMFSSKEHSTAVGLELEKLNGWFSRYPTNFLSATNGDVKILQFATAPGMSDNPYRLYYDNKGSGQGQFSAKCGAQWHPLESK